MSINPTFAVSPRNQVTSFSPNRRPSLSPKQPYGPSRIARKAHKSIIAVGATSEVLVATLATVTQTRRSRNSASIPDQSTWFSLGCPDLALGVCHKTARETSAPVIAGGSAFQHPRPRERVLQDSSFQQTLRTTPFSGPTSQHDRRRVFPQSPTTLCTSQGRRIQKDA